MRQSGREKYMSKIVIRFWFFLIYGGFSVLQAQTTIPTPSLNGVAPNPKGRLVHRKVLASEEPDSKLAASPIVGDGQLITVIGSLKKFVSADGSFGYAEDGEFTYLLKGQSWLKGKYEKGTMVGSWKLYALDDPNHAVEMNFLEISNQVLKEQRHQIFPYYLDLEGKNKYEVFIVTSHGILILSNDSKIIFSSLMTMNLGDGKDIAFDRISKNGPFCFWTRKSFRIWDSVDENSPMWHFGSELIFYIYSNDKLTKVFDRSFDAEYMVSDVFLADVNNSNYKELHCHDVVAHWDPNLNQFIENSKLIPINH
jgi:hypothetical protein